jgi:pyruvate/2-oxoglutarate dehydrogenase complex dihydrolipoamide acyltransferase (E2) component
MSDPSDVDIAARVVAWHNRHPLARRLRVADVFSVGHVALPYLKPAAARPEHAAGGAGSLRERAIARARELPGALTPAADPPLQEAFSDNFIPPLAPTEVAAFGARHGIERLQPPVGAPIRRVPAHVSSGSLAWRWLLTAELRAGSARTRVLLGSVPGAPVLGRRLWSLPRVAALAALGGATVALLLAIKLGEPGEDVPATAVLPPGALVQPVAAVAPVASMAAPASAAASAPVEAAASAPTEATATAASAASPAASRPIDVEPRLGKIDLPPIGGVVDARRRQAAAAAAASAAAPAAAASVPVFALATRPLRTRAESQQIAEALTTLLVVPGSPVQRVDVLPAGDDFRVVAWPYAGRTEAQQAQARLLARGHRLQVISF